MNRITKTISRYCQRVALVFGLLSFTLQPALALEVSRLAELNNTEEVCTLTESATAEVPTRKREVREAFPLPARPASFSHVRKLVVSRTVPLVNSSLEVFLRKLRI